MREVPDAPIFFDDDLTSRKTQTSKEPSGIGGWMILPILGLFLLPFRLGYTLYSVHLPIFTDGYWELLTDPNSETYHPLWAPMLLFEVFGNFSFAIGAILLLVLCFMKQSLFPKLMVGFLGANVLFVVVDYFLANAIPAVAEQDDPESLTGMIRTIVGASIWIPYFLVSERVKNTFVKRHAVHSDAELY